MQAQSMGAPEQRNAPLQVEVVVCCGALGRKPAVAVEELFKKLQQLRI
jgi:hypothetical protein